MMMVPAPTVVPIPNSTSAEAFERYVGGKRLKSSRGKAWREIKAWIIEPPRLATTVPLPGVSESSLAWTFSGEAEFDEREGKSPWKKHRIRKGSFFLTSGGPPYECRWRALGDEPFQTMIVFIELSLLNRAFEEVFGADAPRVRLKDLSAFTDPILDGFMDRLREELMRRSASPLAVQGLAQFISIHLARNYAEAVEYPSVAPSLPGFKLRQIIDGMTEKLSNPFDLDALAAQAGLSKFHFSRLFKNATGVPPAHFLQNLRMNEARRLLRESQTSIVGIALDVGYNNPSRFAKLFRRETGLSPSEYRRER